MSRRSIGDEVAGTVGNILMTSMLAAGIVAVMAGIAIAELLRTPTEERLRRLAPPETWGALISRKSCPHCHVSTEAQAGYCHLCGKRLS